MKTLIMVLIISLCLGTINSIQGQSMLDRYKNHPKTEVDFETDLVTAETIFVSPEKPLVIKSPDKKEIFKVYTFTKVWDNGKFKAFVGLSDDPFKPNLVITDKEQTEIDKIQLLGNHGPNRTDYEVVEEVKISGDQDIILTAKIYTWTLGNRGEKIKGSEKATIKVDKYIINNKGQLQKI